MRILQVNGDMLRRDSVQQRRAGSQVCCSHSQGDGLSALSQHFSLGDFQYFLPMAFGTFSKYVFIPKYCEFFTFYMLMKCERVSFFEEQMRKLK